MSKVLPHSAGFQLTYTEHTGPCLFLLSQQLCLCPDTGHQKEDVVQQPMVPYAPTMTHSPCHETLYSSYTDEFQLGPKQPFS